MEILVVGSELNSENVINAAFDGLGFEMKIDNINAENGLNFDLTKTYDLVFVCDEDFLDFGFQLKAYVFSHIMQKNIPAIVFLNDKDRVDIFCGLNLLDYFFEPVDWQRVQLRLKVLNVRQEKIEKTSSVPDKFVIKQKNEVILVDYNDIIFFEKDGKKLFVHLKDEVITVQESIKVLMTRVPTNFIRVHNSYVVNTTYISRIIEVGNRSYEIQFTNSDQVALMSRYRSDALLKDYYRLSKTKTTTTTEEKSS